MIQVDGLSYTYPGTEKQILKNISFKVGKGEIFGFLGPSGAGKSTTQKVLNGLLRGFEGTVRVNGSNPEKKESTFYEKIGVAFEFPNLYMKLSALENLELFASFFKGETRNPEELLEMVELSEDKHTRVEAFSKGMKMRLNFVRALLNKPEILFLDEPTAGLDPRNARIMKDIILDLQNKGASIFLTTHHMADAEELCDNIAFMVEGTLPVIDSTENLKLEHGRKVVSLSYHENGEIASQDFPLDKLAENKEFMETIRNREIETIHTLEASMEEIFIKVTGHHLIQ